MSSAADIQETLRRAKDKYGLSEEQCVELLVDIYNDLEWDLIEVYMPYNDTYKDLERKEAHRILFSE